MTSGKVMVRLSVTGVAKVNVFAVVCPERSNWTILVASLVLTKVVVVSLKAPLETI